MKRTTATLADGREILYFDRDDGAVRELLDPRALTASHPRPQIRHDPVLDEWVVMATHRQARTYFPADDECPLCPSTPTTATEIPSPDYEVVVLENRFPSLSAEVGPGVGTDVVALSEVRGGFGRCEVLCFTSDHGSSFADLSPEQAELVVEAWIDRTDALAAMDGVEQVFCFESRGREIGVTLSHPHGQIYAYPFVTPRTARLVDVARAYRQQHGSDLHDDVVAAELADGRRVVLETEHWVAFVPAAARWPVEVHVYPRRRRRTLADLDAAERSDLATTYLDLLRRLDRLYDARLPYVAAWHQTVRSDVDALVPLHLQLFSIRRTADKLKFLAGSESGVGAFITDALPEDVASRLQALAPV